MESDIVAHEPVRTYNYIDPTFCQIVQNRFNILGRTGAGYVFDTHGEILQSVPERLIVLIGQYGSRHQYRYLFAVCGGFECGTNSHFRLAETDITADKPIHRTIAFHIGFYLCRGTLLIGRIFVQERGFQFVL